MCTGLLPKARSRVLQDALDRFTETISQESAPRIRIVYSTNAERPSNGSAQHVAVLDASFNPPTRAHLALAQLPRSVSDKKQVFDAHMLIFSVRNADKGKGRPGDASMLQRLEMVELLARQLESDLPSPNISVALVDEPLVFAKSTLIHSYWDQSPAPRLYWLMGSDTLTRVFQSKYYGSQARLEQWTTQFFEKEQSVILCAERPKESSQGQAHSAQQSSLQQESEEVRQLLTSPGPAHDWYERGSIELRTINSDAAWQSSTAVRKFLRTSQQDSPSKQQLSSMVPDTLVDYLQTRGIYNEPLPEP
ncbi:nicotinamide-nucleotide adenylyltransferase [Malassezia yamatoensis]|uniref:Nicotinamide-nucleotide adenylyltransferase n=1 Tax=Malassezia yamatoensis TaxID=253288 RepID=A0AAJ6CG27_9BASI|nr:nicotinamide-nucleotide adenylyltransferase [Malassezia yamatoensis]